MAIFIALVSWNSLSSSQCGFKRNRFLAIELWLFIRIIWSISRGAFWFDLKSPKIIKSFVFYEKNSIYYIVSIKKQPVSYTTEHKEPSVNDVGG